MDSILQKFKAKFIDEAHGLLDNLERGLLLLEKGPNNTELIESAFKAMHTIKGVSGMYGFDYISGYTHQMESIYQSIRDKNLAFDKEIFDISFASVDHLRQLLADENLANAGTLDKHNNLIQRIQAVIDSKAQTNNCIEENNTGKKVEIEAATYNILINTNENLYFRGISLTNIFRELATLGEFSVQKATPVSNDDSELWSVFLSTHASIDDINDVLLFIEDDCVVRRVGKKETLTASAGNSLLVEKSINILTNVFC